MNYTEKKIAEIIEAEHGNITTGEIASRLYVSISTVQKTVKKYKFPVLKAKRIYSKKLAPCKNRPFCCFDCKYEECICNSKANEQETRFCQMM